MKISEQVRQLAEPVVEQNGCTLWDVEYVKEGGERYLRLFIDKADGVNITDCEAISRAMDPLLDEADPIAESYRFEVCSAGLERALKRPSDFARYMGAAVLVRLYQPKNGAKEFAGILKGYDNGSVSIELGGETISFNSAEVALVRLRLDG